MKLSRGDMNSDPREKTSHLADKLLRIRTALGLSQTQLLGLLDLAAYYHHTRISLWERGYREPPIKVLLKYARVAGISTDVLIDDYFFFFQAEDGIRDFHVTGVQTSALPI